MNRRLQIPIKAYEEAYIAFQGYYTSRMIYTHLGLLIGLLPFPFFEYQRFYGSQGAGFIVRRTLVPFGFILILIVAGILLTWRKRIVQKHLASVRWCLDILYNLFSAYIGYSMQETMRAYQKSSFDVIYSLWFSLIMISICSLVSRWYMKITCCIIVTLQIGIVQYLQSRTASDILAFVYLSVLLGVFIFFLERGLWKQFLKSYLENEETQLLKETLHYTNDGMTIKSIHGELLYQNWQPEKYSWWNINQSFEENIGKIQLEKIERVGEIAFNTVISLNLKKFLMLFS